jgi:hypothetical protein
MRAMGPGHGRRSGESFDLKPPLVAIAGGAVDGLLEAYAAPKACWAPGAWRIFQVLLGGGGFLLGLPDDISYTAMSQGLYRLTEQVPVAISQKSGKVLLGQVASGRLAAARGPRPDEGPKRRAAGCASCAGDARLAGAAMAMERPLGVVPTFVPTRVSTSGTL